MKKYLSFFKKPWVLGIVVVCFSIWVLWQIPVEKRKYGFSQNGLATDYTGLLPEKIERVVGIKDVDDIQKIVKEANKNKTHVSIAGLQHSQGGHSYYPGGVVLDMRAFNQIIKVDEKAKTVKVESGASWEDVQEAITPYGLALKVTQSQSIFTIGGSLSVNGHGRDIRFGPMAGTVREMTLLTPTGEIKNLDKNDKENWMKYVLGGYGLFGVILDVTFDLTDNHLYTIRTQQLKTEDYESYYKSVMRNNKISMHYARISVAPSTFLEEMYVIDYNNSGKKDSKEPLKGEEGVRVSKLALDIGRKGGKLEDLFWESQRLYINSIDGKQITRNNAMRSESTFMEFTKPRRVEVLQEFFIPVDSYEEYMMDLKKLLPSNDKNQDFKVHNITVRHAAEDKITSLPYAKEDMLGLVILLQHGLAEKEIAEAKELIQEWTDLTLKHGGSYYLPYYPYQTKEQFTQSYPEWKDVQQQKKSRDPNEVLVNLFYDNYIK